MLKDYLKEKNISMYILSKSTEIAYSTLHDLCSGKVEIENCKVNILLKLSDYLHLSIEEVYKLCKNEEKKVVVEEYGVTGNILVRNKKYYIEYFDGNKKQELYLFKVNTLNNKYLKEAAQWVLEEKLIEEKMENLYAIQSNA